MQKAQNRIAVIVCICFVLASILTPVVAFQSDHECSGEHCEICLQIAHITNALKQCMTAVFAVAVAVSAAAMSAIWFAACDKNAAYYIDTPITRKVQMNR